MYTDEKAANEFWHPSSAFIGVHLRFKFPPRFAFIRGLFSGHETDFLERQRPARRVEEKFPRISRLRAAGHIVPAGNQVHTRRRGAALAVKRLV